MSQVQNTGNLYIAGNTYINTDFTNTATASYRNNGHVYITGNFTNHQTFMNEGAGTILFTGNSPQIINGSRSPVFHDVNINNIAGVQMNVNVLIRGLISPVAGSLYFNDYSLTMDGKIDTAYTNTAAFSVTPASNLFITGNASSGNKLYFDPAANTLHNLIVSIPASAVLGNTLGIAAGSDFGTVIVNGNLDAAGFLVLRSDTLGTARVGFSLGTITGEATVQRYFPARRAWRFVGVPFNRTSQTINAAWQEGYVDTILQCPPQHPGTPGFGISISNKSDAVNGFDANNTGNPSVYVYQNNAWSAPSTTYSNLRSTADAYFLFVRGDRTVCTNYAASPTTTVLRPKGVLNQNGSANVVRNFSGTTNDYIMIGNPYASSVDINNVIKTGSGIYNNKFWVWNPRLAGQYGVGGYVAFTLTGNIFVPNDSTYTAGTIIQSGQGFMVQKNSTGTGSLTFRETNKSASQTVTGVFGLQAAQSSSSPAAIFINLLDTNNGLADGVGAAFNTRYAAAVDSLDVSKRWNEYSENMALMRNDTALAIELRPVPRLRDTLFLRMYLRQQPYLLKVFAQNLPANIQGRAWLEDKYLGTETEINLHEATYYNFTPNADTNSYRNRFMLVFSRVPFVFSASTDRDSANNNAIAKAGHVILYPNPVTTGRKITLQFNNVPAGNYTVVISDVSGKPVLYETIEHRPGKHNYSLELNNKLASGEYNVKVSGKKRDEYEMKMLLSR